MIIAASAIEAVGLGDSGTAGGLVAFVVMVGLVVASFFLFRSMARHIRKVPPRFDEEPAPPVSSPTASPPAPPVDRT